MEDRLIMALGYALENDVRDLPDPDEYSETYVFRKVFREKLDRIASSSEHVFVSLGRHRIRMAMVAALIAALLIALSGIVYAAERFVLYPVTQDSPEWKSYESHEEMIEALRVDESVLKDYSTEELLKATLEYPLIVDVLLNGTVSSADDEEGEYYLSHTAGLDVVREYCTALNLLLERGDLPRLLESLDQDMLIAELDCSESNKSIAPMILEAIREYVEIEYKHSVQK